MSDALYLAELGAAQPGDLVTVAGDEGRHAAVVKRTRPGESVLVSDGQGAAIRGVVVEVTKQLISVQVSEVLAEPRPRHEWIVVQALPKADRAEIAVQALTELGAAQIIAWQAARSIARWDGAPGKADKGIAKWQATARESTKQSRRFRVPKLSHATTAEIVSLVAEAGLALVCHEDAKAPLAQTELPASGQVVIIIGPEGGLAPEELAAFTAAGARTVSLGDGVLRTSTAGVVALAQLQALACLQ